MSRTSTDVSSQMNKDFDSITNVVRTDQRAVPVVMSYHLEGPF